ncbi:MAG: OadG family protein [Bacteroidaceae bacterium]|nr:OadG family protein [Bacteroidaceae bacterium]
MVSKVFIPLPHREGWDGSFLLLLILLAGFTSCNKQEDETSKVVLNEVLSLNEGNFQDDYGVHNAWIEVFNKSYGTVDIAGYKLAVYNGMGDTVTYNVPKGDVLTKIKPRQHALFWADGEPNRGTFHTTCTLDTARVNWVGLYDNGGKLIDQIEVPVLEADHSYARINDANPEWAVKGGDEASSYVTPSTNNMTIEKNEKQEKFALHDASGIGMAITAMLVVFSGLIILYVSFRLLGLGMQSKKSTETSKTETMTENQPVAKAEGKEGEVYAAIAMALHEEMNNVHDIESGVLTITHRTSAWNAKHLMLRK